jgi:hypothetical protein
VQGVHQEKTQVKVLSNDHAWSELVSCSKKLRRSSAVKVCKKEHKKSSEEDADKGQAP